MSSAYLTSTDMLLIECLLAEHGRDRSGDWKTAASRLLIRAMEQGTCDETSLRQILARHVQFNQAVEAGLAEWESEGGALPRAAQAARFGRRPCAPASPTPRLCGKIQAHAERNLTIT